MTVDLEHTSESGDLPRRLSAALQDFSVVDVNAPVPLSTKVEAYSMSGLFIDAVETVNGLAVEQVAAQQRAEGFYGGFARRDQLAVNGTGWWQHIDQQIAN